MNKKLLPIIIILSIVLSLSIFVACDKEVQDPHQFLNVKLTDGTNTDTWINVQYQYGQTLDIFDTLQIVLEFRDGSVTLTSESPEVNDVTITYSKNDGTIIEAFSKYSVLSPGNYQVTVTYNGSTATLSVYISQADFKDTYRLYVKDADAEGRPNMSQYNYGDENKTIAIYTTAGAELNKSLINSLYVLTSEEKEAYDAIESEEAQIEYLNAHLSNSIGMDYETGELYTTMLLPGNYFMFALLNSTETQVSGYTKPTNPLRVNKGKIVFSNEFWAGLNVHGEYQFDNYVLSGEEPRMTKNGVKALSLMEVGINYVGLNEDDDHDDIVVEGATYNLGTLGTFVYTSTDTRVDASDNGTNKQVKFTLIDYFNERYIVTTSATSSQEARWYIPLQITKAEIPSPYYQGTIQNNLIENAFSYDGDSHNISGQLHLELSSAFISATGNAATNAGTYNAVYSLKDNINYKWAPRSTEVPDNYYGQYSDAETGSITFEWELSKAYGYFDYRLVYLGSYVDGTTINYEMGAQNNKSISIQLSSDYINAVLAEGKSITWVNDYGGSENQNLKVDTSNHTALNAITFTKLEGYGLSEYVNIFVSIPECDNYFAYNTTSCVCSVTVNKDVFTSEEVDAIFDSVGATTQIDPVSQMTVYVYPDLNIYRYFTIDDPNYPDVKTIDHYKIPGLTVPDLVTYNGVELGTWKLYHFSELTADVEYANNEEFTTLPSNDGWHLIFYIEDPCACYVPSGASQPHGIDIDVENVSFTEINITPAQI